MKTVECNFCGAEFKRYRSQIRDNNFCSKECSDNFKNEKKTVQCSNCGKKLSKRPSKIKGKDSIYCSRNCMGQDTQKRVEVKCSECKEFFEKPPSEISDKNFCSQDCQRKNYSQKVTVKCDICKTELERSLSHIEEHVFCSYDCEGEWLSENRTGEDNPRWEGGRERYYGPNWLTKARQVRKRDNYNCQRCGISQEDLERKLDVHHRKRIKDFRQDGEINFEEANKKSNLISYCRKCHRLVESGSCE